MNEDVEFAMILAAERRSQKYRNMSGYRHLYALAEEIIEDGGYPTPKELAKRMGRHKTTLSAPECVARRDVLHAHGYAMPLGGVRFRFNEKLAALHVEALAIVKLEPNLGDLAWMRPEGWALGRLEDQLAA